MHDLQFESMMIKAIVHALVVGGVLTLTACTPEQTPASAARTAAALRTPASAATAPQSGTSIPPTLAPAGVARPPTTPQVSAPAAATPTPAPATLTASPNPVRVDAGRLGTTTIAWSTGRSEDGQVFVSENGQPEKLFASGTTGSQDAPWIRAGASYEFRLYAGAGHTDRLAAVTVGDSQPSFRLSADPNPVPADEQELGATTITWTTDSPTGGEVYVSEDGGPERLFAKGIAGAEPADWICRGTTYEFQLYRGPGQSNPLGAITVMRAPDEPGHEPPPSDHCQSHAQDEP
jgi:hypothetical protein